MTDRSSEERSRFEKWAKRNELLLDRKHSGQYEDYAVEYAWLAWRAALREDRQEAAPIQEGLKDLSVRLLREFAEIQPPYDHDNECSFCGVKEGKQHWHTCSWLTARTIFGIGPGVPSEATPSKEISDTEYTEHLVCPHCGAHDTYTDDLWKEHDYIELDCGSCGGSIYAERHVSVTYSSMKEPPSAPAPEVQGTPTKSNVAHQPWCASAPRPMDVPMGRGPYPCDCGTVKAAPAPVGTPQKETPTMPYGAGAQNFGVKTYAETADQIRAATITGTDKFVNSTAPAPEGVQGKEPQTPPDWKSGPAEKAVCEWIVVQHRPKDIAEFMPLLIAMRDEIFASGEAAGRRSAITPEQVEKMREGCHATYNGGHHDAIPYEAFHHGMDTVFNVLKARAERECAELQEKTK